MSGIINKIKDKVTEMKAESHAGEANSASTNHGPHDSNIANKADPRIDSDLDGSRNAGLERHNVTGTTATGLAGTHGHHHGHHHEAHHGTTGAHTNLGSNTGPNTTVGPHSSDTMNKLDPRVDSDLSGGHPGSNTGYGTTGTTGTTGLTGTSYQTTNTTAGPHSSNLANKVDPRVDSDLDGSRTAETGAGYGTSTGAGYGSTNTTAGPHSSNLANKLDPRVDSDLDGSRRTGTTGTTTGTGFGSSNSTAGPHSSNLANRADPRVDSDLSGTTAYSGTTGTTHTTTTGAAPVHNNHLFNQLDPRVDTSGTNSGHHTGTQVTASNSGPVHNSSLLNKLDPRVDSDADGSRNAGLTSGTTTQNINSSGLSHGGPGQTLDAAKHTPSQFASVHGEPDVQHGFPEDASHARHGSIGRSDQHYGSGTY